jgi:zinc transporter ZupT
VLLIKSAISGILLTAGSLWALYLGFPAGPDIAMYLFLAVAGSWALALYMRNLQDELLHEARPRQQPVLNP